MKKKKKEDKIFKSAISVAKSLANILISIKELDNIIKTIVNDVKKSVKHKEKKDGINNE